MTADPPIRYAGHNLSDPRWGNVVDLVPFNLMLEASAMNQSLPPSMRRPLVAYSRFRPMYNWGEAGIEEQALDRSAWWREGCD